MRTRRPDSNAHAIAQKLAGGAPPHPGRPNRTERRLRRASIRREPVVGNYVTPSTSSRFAPQSVTAAAQVIYGKSLAKQKKRPPVAGWQTESWELRKQVPEFRFAGDRPARGASQYKLFAAKRPDTGGNEPEKITEGPAHELCSDLFGDVAATQQALHRAGQHLTFNGDSLLLVSQDEAGAVTWNAHSIRELTGQGKSWKLNSGVESRNLNEDDLVIRCWKPDPEFQELADCPAQAVLPIARTLRALGKRTGAEIDSRLAGAGILWLPSESKMPGPEDDPDSDPFVEEFIDNSITPIQDPDSAAAVVPMVSRMQADLIEKIRYMSFATPLDEKLPEMETSSIRRIALGMDSPPETLLGMGQANHWCTDEITEVFTRDRGWITHDTLEEGDVILTLNHETGESEWQPVQAIYRAHVENEAMLSMESASHSSVTTGHHKWPIVKTGRKVAGSRRRWTTSEQGFSAADRIPVAAPCSSVEQEGKWSDDFVRLVAAYTSDGTILHHKDQSDTIRIAKFDEWEIVEMRRVLTSVFGHTVEAAHPTFTVDGTAFLLRTEEARALFDVTGDLKAVRLDFIHELTSAQLHLFLDSLIEIGDGVANGSARIFYQVERSRLDAIELAAILAGYKVTRGQRNQQTGFGTEPLHWVRVTPSRPAFSPHDCEKEWVEYTGTIWCPTTVNHTWFARRDGKAYFTGNTGWLISSEEVTLVLSPMVATICHALTVGFLHPMLQAAGVEDWADHLIWFDASELELRPDKSVDSRELFEKGAVGQETMRRENGFDENDAPSAKEREENLLTKLLIGAPSLAPLLLPKLGIEVDASVLNKTAEIAEATAGNTPDESATKPAPPPEPKAEQTIPEKPTEQPNDNVETGPGE